MTQEQRVIKWLETHKTGLTQLQAYEYLGIMRLAARVCEIRQKGYDIVSEMVEVTDRWGEKTRVAKYYLKEEVSNEPKTR